MSRPPARILVPNLGARYSGVTSVIRATLPILQSTADAELVGRPAGTIEPARSMLGTALACFRAPAGGGCRVWHARRNIEMVWGVLLRDVLRQPIKLVFTSAAQRVHTAFTDWLIARMDAVIATTEIAAAYLHRPSVLIPHGIDASVFNPAPDRETAWAARGVGGRYGIGIFGRVRHQKGTDLFVEAMIRLLPRYPEFAAVVIGLTKPTEAGFLHGLQHKAEAAGLGDRVLFLGEQPAQSLPLWLASVSICVAPPRNEGFGLVPLEAGASATPVVATRAGAASLTVADGETGFVVEPDDLDALTDRIERLMRDAALRTAMGEAGRRRVLEHFRIENEVRAYVRVYETFWR